MHKFIILLLITCSVSASILPENNLAIPVSMKNQGLSLAEYNLVIDKVEMIYKEVVEEKGRKLVINRLWENPIVNAGTLQRKGEWVVNLYGGYARHPSITPDGYALVICHELGHHLAGPPKKTFENGPGWPSVEGQSDYFATLTCLKRVFEADSNETTDIDNQVIQSLCSDKFQSVNEIKVCKRILSAGLAVSAVSASIRGTELPDLLQKDESVVTQIFEAHPEPQCRLDTYLSGALEKSRPSCWYFPE